MDRDDPPGGSPVTPFADGMIVVRDIVVRSLTDAWGAVGARTTLFPDRTEQAWSEDDRTWPSLGDAAGNWVLPFRSFLIEAAETRILVDTGIGPSSDEFTLSERSGLLAALAARGIGADQIDLVLLTHLHSDHIGWNIDERSGRATFPNARYLTHPDGWAWANTPGRRAHPAIASQVLPLERLAVLDFVDDGARLAAEVTVRATPGHAPGHVSVIVGGDADTLVLLGDVAVHPAQIADPEMVYLWDGDPRMASDTRTAMDALMKDGTRVACGHYPGSGIGTIERDLGPPRWAPIVDR